MTADEVEVSSPEFTPCRGSSLVPVRVIAGIWEPGSVQEGCRSEDMKHARAGKQSYDVVARHPATFLVV